MGKALTGAALTKIKPDPDKRQEIPDGVLVGLYFVVQPTGRKSWAVRYRHNGKPRKMALGNYLAGDDPAKAGAELKKVRIEAADILGSVRGGADPASEKLTAKRLVKDADDSRRDHFRVVVERYLREYAAKRRNFSEKARLLGMRLKGDEWETIEGKPAVLWATKRVQEITRRDIRDYVEGMAETAPIGANRAFAELRKFFNWCVGKDILAVSPMAGLQPPSEENASRNRVLIRRTDVPGSTDDELRWLWQAADAYDRNDEGEHKGGGRRPSGPFGPFLQFLILTGQRRTEVSEMTWREVDMEQRVWTIPKERAKNGLPHAVPLSAAAMALLEAMPRIKGSKSYVFTTDGESSISGFSRMKQRVDRLMKEASDSDADIPPWTVHDLRRTVAAGMQRLGVRLEVTERVLNHLSGSFAGIAGVYQVHDFHEEKRAALDAWASFVTDLVEGRVRSNVTYLHAERA
ncbi:tyrosine-type recombinase/integrase [Mesorhizobium sp. ASY16-5R]|uniref:tyrosine-type recombinase/integrase n=1 Tax=Mesorhizobium sp. ASY16-5R TaxID=3445772 RepID=UPI003FA0FE2C